MRKFIIILIILLFPFISLAKPKETYRKVRSGTCLSVFIEKYKIPPSNDFQKKLFIYKLVAIWNILDCENVVNGFEKIPEKEK